MNRIRRHRNMISTAVLIVVGGLMLRCVFLDQRSVWFDEASSWLTATLSFSELIASLKQSTHVPLYYPLLRGWMWCFGESPVAMRSFSVLAGMLTVAGCWPLGTVVLRQERALELQSETVRSPGQTSHEVDAVWFGLFCSAICATSAFMVHASVEARMYSLGTFLFVVSNYVVLRIAQSPDSIRLWGLLVSVTIAELYTHHFLAMTVGVQAIWLFIQLRRTDSVVHPPGGGLTTNSRAGEKIRTPSSPRRYWLASFVVVAVAWIPGLILWWSQFRGIRQGFWIPPVGMWTIPRTVFEFLIGSIPGLRGELDWPSAFVAVVCMLLVLRAAIACRAAVGFMLLQGTVPMIVIWFVSVFTPIWQARYFRFAFIGLMISMAWVVWKLTGSGRKRQCVCAVTLLVCLAGTIVFWARRDIPHRQAMRGAFAFIAEREDSPESARLIITRPMEFVIAKYYAPHFGFPRKHVALWTGRDRHLGLAPHLIRAEDWWKPDETTGDASSFSVWTVFPADQPPRFGLQRPVSPVFRSDLHLVHWRVQAARFDGVFAR